MTTRLCCAAVTALMGLAAAWFAAAGLVYGVALAIHRLPGLLLLGAVAVCAARLGVTNPPTAQPTSQGDHT